MEGDFNHWEELFNEIDQKVGQTVDFYAEGAKHIAQSLSRVDTGTMKEDWYVRTEHGSDRIGGGAPDSFPEIAPAEHNEAILVGGSMHTVYNEYGTYKMSAKPMAVPAIEQIRQPFLEKVAEDVHGSIG